MQDDASGDCGAQDASPGPETACEGAARDRSKPREAALRLCVTMTLLPRAPQKISARALTGLLAEAGWDVTVRTVERDLHRLRSVFPIRLDDEHKPFGWSWVHDRAIPCLEP